MTKLKNWHFRDKTVKNLFTFESLSGKTKFPGIVCLININKIQKIANRIVSETI